MTAEEINQLIKDSGVSTNLINDGYHTFGELYEHRIELFISTMYWLMSFDSIVEDAGGERTGHAIWKSKKHSDGSEWAGWFISGINMKDGRQITYHLPDKYWDRLTWVLELDQAPTYDGHTSTDVLERLREL